MEMVMNIIKSLIAIAPFVICCLLIKKINLTPSNRGRQFAMPIIALIYCIVAAFYVDKINIWILDLMAYLTQYIPFLGNFDWSYLLMYLSNFAIALAFAAVKSVLMPVLNGIWSRRAVMENTSGLFYEYNEDVDKWLLSNKSGQIKKYYTGFYFAALAVSTLVFVFSRNFRDAVIFSSPFYPVFGILVLGEIFFLLSGLTKTEFVEDILGEDEEAYKVVNYGMLRNILRDFYGDRVLYDNTMDLNRGIESNFETLDEMLSSDDKALKNLGQYFQNLKDQGEVIDVNYIKSCINLTNGKSTLFCNPFYKDLTHYLMFPTLKKLMQYRKCLIVVGRESAAEDVKKWVEESIFEATNTSALWKAGILTKDAEEVDVGILKFSDLYNLSLHDANIEFLKRVGFVFIIEPSKILTTGQVGLKLIVEKCEEDSENLVFAACDRNCDGLVDALSHTLKTSITSVMATLQTTANSSHMYWNADGPYMHHKILPNIAHYLGIGTEISAVALKYQISKTTWISSDKFPVLDMKWITGQYYSNICSFANLPSSQDSFNKAFTVEPNLWNQDAEKYNFTIVEDEFRNLFEMTRVYASRAKSQGFVNVISENYFLRDYMLDNVDTFVSDPKAIPTIVADFARTERNVVLKLIMQMANDMISEATVEKEFNLGGIVFKDSFETLKKLIEEHCNVKKVSLGIHFKEKLEEDGLSTVIERYFYIDENSEISGYVESLRNAYYIAEDETGNKHYVGAKLYGHVFQAILPGQFLTIGGKYYEVRTITPQNGVVVRRAADHITSRKYYRQIRTIHLNSWKDDESMGGKRKVSDIEITHGYCEIVVDTRGFVELDTYGNLKNGKPVMISSIPSRKYQNKSVLKIKLPEADAKVRYTICLLLNEIFRTTYPDACHYICAVMPNNAIMSERLRYAMYDFDCCDDNDCIYIVEDSEIDLGLIVSVDRNLKRYFEIITDVLSWHSAKMLEEPEEEKDPEPFVPEFTPTKKPKKGISGVVEKVGNFFKGLFGKKKKAPKGGTPTVEEPDSPVIPADPDQVLEPENPDIPVETGEVETEIATGTEAAEVPVEDDEAASDGEQSPVEAADEAELVETEDQEEQEPSELVQAEAEEIVAEPAQEEITPEEYTQQEQTPEVQETETLQEEIESSEEEDSVLVSRSYGYYPLRDEAVLIPKEEELTDENEVPEQELTGEEIPLPEQEDIPEPVEEVATESEQEDIPNVDIEGESEELVDSPAEMLNKTDYQKNCYLKFGFDDFDEALDVVGTIKYLTKYGYNNSGLQQVRGGAELAEEFERTYDPHKYGVHYCDFCGVELAGGEYDLLKDGRERCNHCSATALGTDEDFKKIFKSVMRNMEIFYGIKLNVAIKVRMTDAKKLAKQIGETFVATPGFDGRVLGFAKKDKTGYSIYVENGSPKLAAMATIAHELTHIWQYLNWNDKELKKRYGKENVLEVYEGMAKWAEIQYLLYLNEVPYAKRQEIATRLRDDEYGHGFVKYATKYPLSYSGDPCKRTPFEENPPL